MIFAALFHALTGARMPAAEGVGIGADLGLPDPVCREVLRSGRLAPHFGYRHFTLPKKTGGRRAVAEPDARLKEAQRAIIARYFAADECHPAAIAYRAKKSIAHHVWPHAGADFMVSADIEDFFPNTLTARVEAWWRERVTSEQARLLTALTTDRGALPQGAPTSPALSNFVNRELDEELARRAAACHARYTRYCDDMLFSWRWGVEPSPDFEAGVRAALHGFGYILHPKKGWRLHRRRDEPEITGLILTRHGGVRVPDRIYTAMNALKGRNAPADADRLAGYRGYVRMARKRPRK